MKNFLKKFKVDLIVGFIFSLFGAYDNGLNIAFNFIVYFLLGFGISYFVRSKLLKKRKSQSKEKQTASLTQTKPTQVKNAQETISTDASPRITIKESNNDPYISIKRVIDNLVLKYYYSVKYIPSEKAESIALKMRDTESFEFDITIKNDKIYAFYDGEEFGEIIEKQRMIKDWLAKNDLLKVYFQYYSEEVEKCKVFICFYRDEQALYSKRENTIIKLTNYKNEDARTGQIGLEDGALLDFDTDIDFEAPEDTVWITYVGCEIGRLPKKYANKYLAQGASAVFFDHFDVDENYEDIPYVKIYW